MRLTSRLLASSSRSSIRRARLLESLESRLLLAATPFTPAQIRHAYGIDQIIGDGTGQTIALVEAYADTHIATDLNTFDQAFSINGGPSLYTQYGAASSFLTVTTLGVRPRSDAGWGMETALDAEWAHVVAPGAKIAIIQANSASLADLLTAVDYARNLAGVSVISMSWGANDFSGESAYNSHFTTPTGHTNITFVASSGDSGTGTSWPAISSNVVSVGGTSLTINADGSYGSESVWSGSGGGYSAYESKPSYQSSVNSTSFRSNPDVAFDADPNTGFYVYDSNYNGSAGWWSVGGTGAGAPQWAALVALANQGRSSALTSSQTLKTLYTLPSADFHDITTGSNGFSATVGYDLATGLGTPNANLVIAGLISSTIATSTSDYSGSTGGGGGGGNPGKGHGNNSIQISGTDSPQRPAVTETAGIALVASSSTSPRTLPALITFTSPAPVSIAQAGISLILTQSLTGSQAESQSESQAESLSLSESPTTPALQPSEAAIPAIASTDSSSPINAISTDSAESSAAAQPTPTAPQAPLAEELSTPARATTEAAMAPVYTTPSSTRWLIAVLTLPFLAWASHTRKEQRAETIRV